MTNFSELDVHSQLCTLDKKMREEISSRYDSLVEKATKGTTEDLHTKAKEFSSSSLDFLSFKDAIVEEAMKVVYTCTLDSVSGIRNESLVPMNDYKAGLVYYCLNGFSCSEMNDFDGLLPAENDEFVNWMMDFQVTTGSISEFVSLVKQLKDKVTVWVSEYLKKTPVHLDTCDIMVDTESSEWSSFVSYFEYFLLNLAMHLGTEKCCFEVSTNSCSEHFVYKYFMTHVLPDLGVYTLALSTEEDDEFDEVLEELGVEDAVFTEVTLNIPSEYFDYLVYETYVVLLGFNSRREALEYYYRPDTKRSSCESFQDFIDDLGVKKVYVDLRNRMRDEIKTIVDTQFSDWEYLDLVQSSIDVVDSCILNGWVSSDFTTVHGHMIDTDAEAVCTCIPDFEFGEMTEMIDDVDENGETIYFTKTLWKYSPTDKNSAVKEFVEYLLSLKEKIADWLVGYFSKNPIVCVEGTYTLNDENKSDWAPFLDYASHIMLRLAVKGFPRHFYTIVPSVPYERYVLRYVLNLFKEQMDIRVLYDGRYEKDMVSVYTKRFNDVRFSPVFENNYTKRVLNLSESDTVNNPDMSVRDLEIYTNSKDKYIIIKGRDYDEDYDKRLIEFWEKRGYTDELNYTDAL